MKIKLPLVKSIFSDQRIEEIIGKDIDKECNIYIYKDEDDWIINPDTHVYNLWIEYGYDLDNTIMFEIDLNDLEMFANSLTKSIEMLRRDYSDVLKEKIKSGDSL